MMRNIAPNSMASADMAATSKGRIAEGLRHMVDEADQLLRSAVTTGDRQFDEARIRMEHQLSTMRMQLDELEQTALRRARQAMRLADQAVQTHPYRAMGIAAAAGVLVGLLIARR